MVSENFVYPLYFWTDFSLERKKGVQSLFSCIHFPVSCTEAMLLPSLFPGFHDRRLSDTGQQWESPTSTALADIVRQVHPEVNLSDDVVMLLVLRQNIRDIHQLGLFLAVEIFWIFPQNKTYGKRLSKYCVSRTIQSKALVHSRHQEFAGKNTALVKQGFIIF